MAKKDQTTEPETTVGAEALAAALVQAINLTKPKAKKQPGVDYDPKNPWQPKPGEARAKLKRKAYLHGIPQGEEWTNELIELFNKLKPGSYLNGLVKITRRRDKGINIDWPFRTPEQRLRLLMSGGFTSLAQVFQACIHEAETKVAAPADSDDL